ncbi:hypothetical protein LX64_02899 [Chitinophaga skermanii]|uniref:Uncharacterized protein n=1 Tax=Chitinophaga skermanii TaxID=331697 RepID=A0A327QK09_9BACT|nr:hypothetical protein LX64_02899 [Chitinophaga skermanii]
MVITWNAHGHNKVVTWKVLSYYMVGTSSLVERLDGKYMFI